MKSDSCYSTEKNLGDANVVVRRKPYCSVVSAADMDNCGGSEDNDAAVVPRSWLALVSSRKEIAVWLKVKPIVLASGQTNAAARKKTAARMQKKASAVAIKPEGGARLWQVLPHWIRQG